MLCDESTLLQFKNMFGPMQFLEVQGMGVGENRQYNLLVTPVLNPVPPAVIVPAEEMPNPNP